MPSAHRRAVMGDERHSVPEIGAAEQPSVLVIDADAKSRAVVLAALADAGYAVAEAANGLDAMRRLYSVRPGAIIVDLDLPELGGLQFLHLLRAATDAPVVAMAGERSRLQAHQVLDAGADDSIAKPFHAVELLARLRAALRRVGTAVPAVDAPGVVRSGALVIDRSAGTVTLAGRPISLTRTEHALLGALASRVGQLSSHRYLLSTVWGQEYIDDTQYLRVYIGYLRNKIEVDPRRPAYLLNEWGLGYRLADLPLDAGASAPPAARPAIAARPALAAAF